MNIAARLDAVRLRIAAASAASGRAVDAVRLVAVSKTKSEAAVREAYAAGQRAFGENYAKELAAKAEALADLPDIEWHFIGHLQTNKARIAARYARAVHTVDSTALARELGKRAGGGSAARIDALVEVNVAGEAQKAGVSPCDLEEVLRAVEAEPSLALRGLMTVPPADSEERTRKAFETLALLRQLHGGEARLPDLSMGMSGDLELAVASGATFVRVGTAIFGER